eukprot:6811437-Pyramimonas_sp.AAC.1
MPIRAWRTWTPFGCGMPCTYPSVRNFCCWSGPQCARSRRRPPSRCHSWNAKTAVSQGRAPARMGPRAPPRRFRAGCAARQKGARVGKAS